MLKLIDEWPHPLFGVLGVTCQKFKCDDCAANLDGAAIASPRTNAATEERRVGRDARIFPISGMGSAGSMRGAAPDCRRCAVTRQGRLFRLPYALRLGQVAPHDLAEALEIAATQVRRVHRWMDDRIGRLAVTPQFEMQVRAG